MVKCKFYISLLVLLITSSLGYSQLNFWTRVSVQDTITLQPIANKLVLITFPTDTFSTIGITNANGFFYAQINTNSTPSEIELTLQDCQGDTIYLKDSIPFFPDTLFFNFLICDTIIPIQCQANFNDSTSVLTTFFTSFINPPPSPQANYIWTFGDGNGSFSPNPTHTYSQPGIYQVCLNYSDSLIPCQTLFLQIHNYSLHLFYFHQSCGKRAGF